MDHIAIDLGSRESQVCVRSSDATVIEELRLSNRALDAYLAQRPPSRVIVETCAEAFATADMAKRHGHDVKVVPAMLARTLGVGARRTKTDRRDAQALSEVSCRVELPSVHIPTAEARRLKSECGMRDALVRARTMLVNCVAGWLRTQGRRIKRGVPTTYGSRIRRAMTCVPGEVERMLAGIDALTLQIKEAEKSLTQVAKSDAVCTRLMTVPGVGLITAVRFRATVDAIERFGSAHALQSYLGLVPGEKSSSERKLRLGITKAGPTAMRWTLVQAAWCARRARRRDPMLAWYDEIQKRRGKAIAVVALARKIAGIMFAIWRDGSTYNPLHASRTT